MRPPLKSEDHLQAEISVGMPVSYIHLNAGSGKPLLVFFHGYSDTAAAFLKRAFPDLDSRFEILAPNGLFPVPLKREEGWKSAFAWYFADYSKNEVIVPPSVSAQAVSHLIKKLDLESRPKILLGFSQGGFFLPFVLPSLKNVQKMFAIGAAYRPSDFPAEFSNTLDALHGDLDAIIPLEKSKESFARLSAINPKGHFYEFKGLAHTMNDESRSLLKARIEEVFT